MEHEFWHQKWESNDIGFHEDDANPFLVKYFNRLRLSASPRIFLPLCGKTTAIAWLLAQGCRVAGAELSSRAIEQLFDDLKLSPVVERAGVLTHYRAPHLDIYAGDLFQLDSQLLGAVDAVYDRAALVAFPAGMRDRYASHLKYLVPAAPHLLISFEYDQSLMPGPPFAVEQPDIMAYYQNTHDIHLLERVDLNGGLKGSVPAHETIWLLQPKITKTPAM